MKNYAKYRPYEPVSLPGRTWPDKKIEKAPIWCSVDLRDGNQALSTPMGLSQKLLFFRFLADMGFKTIEIGFPAASETEFEFTRALINGNLIPEDVTVQVLTQARPRIIKRTFEALKGAKRAVVHLYNSTSRQQREIVFGNSKEETINLAVFGAKLVKETAAEYPETEFTFEYSPENFTLTELSFAAEICNAITEVWEPSPEKKVIYNLPATVETSTPNIYADQIQYMCGNLNKRDSILVSLHAHNDRGTGVAATELGLMAGADRVEGTLFGNGERTGNADILTLGMNLFTQGVDPELDFSRMNDIIGIYEESTGIRVHPRHPYAGELVFTAFSGSHQDAIKKGMADMKNHPERWEVPYLPLDPMDVGRSYEPIIRINSQSGKGGVAFVLEENFGLYLPKAFQKEVGDAVTAYSDKMQAEISADEILSVFRQEYMDIMSPLRLNYYKTAIVNQDWDVVSIEAEIELNGEKCFAAAEGNGVVSAFCNSIRELIGFDFDIIDYRGHSMELGREAAAISYIEAKRFDGKKFFGAGTSTSVGKSSLRAVVSAVNKMLLADEEKSA